MNDLISRKMQIVINNYFEQECDVNTSIYEAFQKGFRLGVDKMKSVQQWIPVSQRLPEEEDYRTCMECLDGAVWYFTENQTMGLAYYYKSTNEWSTIGGLKPHGKVIAWMPLPERYQ